MRWSRLFLTLFLLGCDRLDAELPALSLRTNGTAMKAPSREAPSRGADENRQLRKRLHGSLLKVRQRLAFVPPAGPPLLPCQAQLLSKEPQSLALRVVDSRNMTKSLLPRRVSEQLESGNLFEWVGEIESLEGKSEEELRSLEIRLQAWDEQRYVGVFFITEYHGPALILRVGELKRSWYPGGLAAQFVLVDTLEQKTICGYGLRVENDTREAPIRSRLQADTRVRLERALGRDLLTSALTALGKDAPGLKLSMPVVTATEGEM